MLSLPFNPAIELPLSKLNVKKFYQIFLTFIRSPACGPWGERNDLRLQPHLHLLRFDVQATDVSYDGSLRLGPLFDLCHIAIKLTKAAKELVCTLGRLKRSRNQ